MSGIDIREHNWWTQEYYGDVHVIPLLDTMTHTFPTCPCKPRVIDRLGVGRDVYRHNPSDERRQ